MSFRVERPAQSLKDLLSGASRPLFGMWVCSGSPMVAEICAGAGLDWLLIDAEHSPNGLESILAQLYAVRGYPCVPVVRPPANDAVLIKQYLDLGAQSLLIPMIESAQDARAAAAAVRYPPHGIRGVGSALARASQWNRIPRYLARASEMITLIVQIETAAAVTHAQQIAATEGIDAVFVGPSDLAASMGLLGQQEHPHVVGAVEMVIEAVKSYGKPVGVNAFGEHLARHYLDRGADFVLVGADVAVLARGSESLADNYLPAKDGGDGAVAASY